MKEELWVARNRNSYKKRNSYKRSYVNENPIITKRETNQSATPVISSKDILEAVAKDGQATKYRNFVENLKVPVNRTYYEAGDGTAAHIAAKYGNLAIVKYSLEKDPTILKYRDIGDNTIFFLAIENGHLDIIKYLIEEHNASISERIRRSNGNTAIHHVCEYGHLAILQYFLEEKNGNVDISNNFNQPPIFVAVLKKCYPIVMYLAAERKADLTKLDHKHNNILFVAVEADDLGIIKYILDKMKANIDINHQNMLGDTIVSRASVLGLYNTVVYLVDEKNAEVNTQDISGKTALHGAAKINHFKLCEFLIKHGADLEARGEDGKRPEDEASNTRVINLFQRQAAKVRERRSVADFLHGREIAENLHRTIIA